MANRYLNETSMNNQTFGGMDSYPKMNKEDAAFMNENAFDDDFGGAPFEDEQELIQGIDDGANNQMMDISDIFAGGDVN